jgi:hypothetical protein
MAKSTTTLETLNSKVDVVVEILQHIQHELIALNRKLEMTIDDTIVQQLIDAITAALQAEANDQAAVTAANATIAQLQSQLAPNPTLLASAQTAIQAALAANPPPTPTPAPTPSPAPTP